MDRKPVFDAVRRLLGRGMRQAEVDQLDRALDTSARAAPGLSVGPRGRDLIRKWEGCARALGDGRFAAYPDPGTGGAPWTIGWGATGPGIGPGTVWTQAQCDARLDADVDRTGAEVLAGIGAAATSQNQFDALASFHYNTGAIGRATLTRLHRAGDHAGAAREFAKWVHAGGRVLSGLVARRAEEAALYTG